MDILALLECLHPSVSRTTLRQFSRIVSALLAMTGRVTMLGLSRWTGKGGSYRTVQRWFYTMLPWAALFSLFFRTHLFVPPTPISWQGMKWWSPKPVNTRLG